MVFAYNVRAGDSDEDGISVGANKLHLNEGCITDFAYNNPISTSMHCGGLPSGTVVSHDALSDDSGHKVAGASSRLTLRGPTTLSYRENRGLRFVNVPEKFVGLYQTSRTDDITWSLSGDDGSLFSIKPRPGANGRDLWFNSPPNYEDPEDADADNVYRVTIEASDGHELRRSRGGGGSHQQPIRQRRIAGHNRNNPSGRDSRGGFVPYLGPMGSFQRLDPILPMD